jgi:thiamine biosynthesis lipoprotein
MDLIILDPEELTAQVTAGGVQVDLGGIGKGYGVDRMARILREWGIERALLHGGSSTVRALEAPPGQIGWPITVSNPDNRREALARLHLKNQALSGSGLLQGKHIIDPRTARPVGGKLATWAYISPLEIPRQGAKLPHPTDTDDENLEGLPDTVGLHPLATFADALSTAFMVMSLEEIKKYCSVHSHVRAMIALEKKSDSGTLDNIIRLGKW